MDLPGVMQPQRIVFLYNIYIPEGTERIEAQSSMRDVEARLHDGLTAHFLTCDAEDDMKYGTVKDFYIWSVSSAPVDVLTSSECTQDYSNSTEPPENSDCFQVLADFGMIAFFPATRRALEAWTEADQQVLEETGEFLDYSMEEGDYNDEIVLQTEFQGFVLAGDLAAGPNINGANTQLQSSKMESNRIVGGTALGFAMLAVLAILIFILYRRRRSARSAQLYLQQLDDMSNSSGLYKDGATVSIVNDTSFDDWMENDDGDAVPPPSPTGIKSRSGRWSNNEDNHQHDVHK
ncbi:MAG: hypothetical protein SGILL_009930, partial [Bacillariaceae sp.]